MNNRHAYCIICHSQPRLLQLLVRLIDDERNDIFLMIDKKADKSLFKDISASKSGLYVLPSMKIWWGEDSQIEAEMRLFETASRTASYSYCHLLSGADLPLKLQDEIHAFFQNHQGKEFVEFWKQPDTYDIIRKRMRKHFFHNYNQVAHRTLGQNLERMLQRNLLSINKRVNPQPRIHSLPELKMGPNWVSVTGDFVKFLMTKRDFIRKAFRHTYCADELFLQSIIWDSPFRENIYQYEKCTGHTGEKDVFGCNMRLIDWTRGAPYTFTHEDIDELSHSDKLFARKIDGSDKELIQYFCRFLPTTSEQNHMPS
ncbi:MAG: glycosyl transferase [Bacteroidaceae bacterium]|nr:glycosyl transferase [Bacteroidaceae bacterium]